MANHDLNHFFILRIGIACCHLEGRDYDEVKVQNNNNAHACR